MPDPLDVRVLRLESWKVEVERLLKEMGEELSNLRETVRFFIKGKK